MEGLLNKFEKTQYISFVIMVKNYYKNMIWKNKKEWFKKIWKIWFGTGSVKITEQEFDK